MIFTRLKKNATIGVAELAIRLTHERIEQIKAGGRLPENAQYVFDEVRELEAEQSSAMTVQKTRRRRVVTLTYGTFEAREVVRRKRTQEGEYEATSNSRLAGLVAPGCTHGFDLTAYVGLESFVFGRRVKEIQRKLEERSPGISLATSTVDSLRRRFLFYLGLVHRSAAPALRELVQGPGKATWLIDGTLEPGTPVFFGVQDARTAVLLGCWKIPTENADDIAVCLKQAVDDYGAPERICHDLNSAMSLACQTALPKTPHDVCHFHFVRDVGEDLLTKPQNALSSRLRTLKLQLRMREQRKTQTEWLRRHPDVSLVLRQLLRGEPFTETWNDALSKEVLLAFHFWILDFAAEGGRQGFPFDPYFLYLHRRLIRGHDGASPMRDQYHLTERDWTQVCGDVKSLTQEYRERLQDAPDEQERNVLTTILAHLDHYATQLAPADGSPRIVRTTNGLEAHWGRSKRICRQTQGRRKLTRTFNALPPELMYVPNLHNPDYVDVVLDGDLGQLAARFADAARNAPSFSAWSQTNTSLNLGRLPARALRRPTSWSK